MILIPPLPPPQIPEGVSDEEGILLGDILSTAFFCAENAFQGAFRSQQSATVQGSEAISAGNTLHAVVAGSAGSEAAVYSSATLQQAPPPLPPPAVLVVGCGPVGLLAIMAAQHLGAGQVCGSMRGGGGRISTLFFICCAGGAIGSHSSGPYVRVPPL